MIKNTIIRVKKTGRNTTGKGMEGVKRILMADASGLSLYLVVSAANTHDIKLAEAVADNDGRWAGTTGNSDNAW